MLNVKIVSSGGVVPESGMGSQVVSPPSTMLADQDVDKGKGTKLVSPLASVVSEKDVVSAGDASGCTGTKLGSPFGNVLNVKMVLPAAVVLVNGMGIQVVSPPSMTTLADQDVDTARGIKLVSPLASVVSEKNVASV